LIYIHLPAIVYVSELTSFPASRATAILRRSITLSRSVDVWTSSENVLAVQLFFTSRTSTTIYGSRFTTFFRWNPVNHCRTAADSRKKAASTTSTFKSGCRRLLIYVGIFRCWNVLSNYRIVRKSFIKTADKSLVNSICECCINILNGCIPLSSYQKAKLKRNKLNLRHLALKKTALGKKRKILQRGGFLSAILSAAIPVVGSLIAGAVNRGRRR